MSTERINDAVALRVGAAAIFLIVGLGLGFFVAVVVLAMVGDKDVSFFASAVFGTGLLSAVLAAILPRAAMALISPLAHIAWGILNGAVVPGAGMKTESDATRFERLLFCAGYVAGCALLVSWLM